MHFPANEGEGQKSATVRRGRSGGGGLEELAEIVIGCSGKDDAVEIVELGGLTVLGKIGINCFELVGGRGGAGEGTK